MNEKNYNIGYQKQGVNLEKKYSIEYINNKKDFERIDTHPAPWELFKSKETDSLEKAIEIFTIFYAMQYDEKQNIYCVKLFEEITLDGETIREEYATNICNFISLLGKEAKHAIKESNAIIKESEAQNRKIESFIKKYHIEKVWQDFDPEENK